MNRRTVLRTLAATLLGATSRRAAARQTTVAIQGDRFLINGQPTYAGRTWRGMKIEGLLMNSPHGAGHLRRPEPGDARTGGPTPTRSSGTRSATRASSSPPCPSGAGTACSASRINLQGGSPQGYSQEQPWHNSGFDPDGTLRPDYLARLERILDRADELGMVADRRLLLLRAGPAARRTKRPSGGRCEKRRPGCSRRAIANVLVEIANECDNRAYEQPIIQAPRVHELIELAKSITVDGRRLPVSTSFNGGAIPTAETSSRPPDFLLLHGNGVSDPDRIARMVDRHATGRRLPADADPVQRGRPLRLRQAAEQLHRGRRASTRPGATSTTA